MIHSGGVVGGGIPMLESGTSSRNLFYLYLLITIAVTQYVYIDQVLKCVVHLVKNFETWLPFLPHLPVKMEHHQVRTKGALFHKHYQT